MLISHPEPISLYCASDGYDPAMLDYALAHSRRHNESREVQRGELEPIRSIYFLLPEAQCVHLANDLASRPETMARRERCYSIRGIAIIVFPAQRVLAFAPPGALPPIDNARELRRQVTCSCGKQTILRAPAPYPAWQAEDPGWLHDERIGWHCAPIHIQVACVDFKTLQGEAK